MLNITCGCDPEVAVYDTNTNKIVPVVGKVPGNKHEPFEIAESKVGLKIQEDNVTLEFNIAPTTVDRFRLNVDVALKELNVQVKKYFGPSYSWLARSEHTFTKEELASEQAQTFGCDPDFLAYERGAMRAPLNPKKVGNVRSYAGHLHIGYDREKCQVPDWAIVQFIEAFVYARHVAEGNDQQGARRGLYGLPGLFRPKPYGLEYRTPSGLWLNRSGITTSIFECAQIVINRPTMARDMWQAIDWNAVSNAISSNGRTWNHIAMDNCANLYQELYDSVGEYQDNEGDNLAVAA